MVSNVVRGLRERVPNRRALTLSVVAVLVLALALAGAVMPVPYVSLQPGPTMNTLGVNPETKKPLIEIVDAQTYPDDGHLNFTTVAYTGDPSNPPTLYRALRDWINPERAVVPMDTIFPAGETAEQVEEANTALMADSQQTSVAAALTQMGRQLGSETYVGRVHKGLPADGVLKSGDQVLAVDGTKVDKASEVTGKLKDYAVGDEVTLTIKRDGKQEKVTLKMGETTTDGAKRAVIGVELVDKFVLPIEVKMNVGEIGGPSAGLMFSLAIYDMLTPGSLTGGKFIAGTGTITVDGQVGAIGGIQQKMIAAKNAGATEFLVPPGNCAEAADAAPDGLRLIKAESLDSAVKSLEGLQAGKKDLPAC
ncbi:PDZ domain-containing protein [Actinocorallia sp. A-T 12471]|uniref:YlbL family protein n=1 Tax=Actinocorallia sp. A-T 12471 TaxID=3089813 RepID=UPI0029CC6CE4|nr:PDZ domain-containing protein [Actinocorallia sp. A-T 12471]MDX6738849.1 PDZ domain-containing protein [Actinocorallia sp. A-T 12471]